MKVTVAKYLNARSREASTDSPISCCRNLGDILDVDDIVSGTSIDGNSIWYHCSEDGCFYWSGGTNFTAEVLKLADVSAGFTPTQLVSIYRSAVNGLRADYSGTDWFLGLGVGSKEPRKVENVTISLLFYVAEDNVTKVPEMVLYRGLKLKTDYYVLGDFKLQEGNGPNLADDPQNRQMGGSIVQVSDNIE